MPNKLESNGCSWCLLDEPVIRWRDSDMGQLKRGSLPELMAALARDRVRDFIALRPHQRHPWHAFLVQLATIALYRAGDERPFPDAASWKAALLALTPDDPDGAAWCLVTPSDRPALLQAPVPREQPATWKNQLHAADELDMLVTSKNHDVKGARARLAEPDDWLFALVSLQTQEGFLGAGNYGISRMNGGFASRPGVGIAATGRWGGRWADDAVCLLSQRDHVCATQGFAPEGGSALLWTIPWDGSESLAISALDPSYIEVCRRVRLMTKDGTISAAVTGSKVARVAAKHLNGITGDAWTPVETAEAKALTVSGAGFEYKLMSDLLVGERFTPGAAWRLDSWPPETALEVIAQATVRGQGKTEGYHERRIPISPKMRRLLCGPQRADVSDIAKYRITAIADVRKLLSSALALLFANGESDNRTDAARDRASRFARPFEQQEDGRFFDDLAHEVEAEDAQRAEVRLQWLLGLVARADAFLTGAFSAGPRSAMQRYKAQSAALSRFHGGLRGTKPVLPDLAYHFAQQRSSNRTPNVGERND